MLYNNLRDQITAVAYKTNLHCKELKKTCHYIQDEDLNQAF